MCTGSDFELVVWLFLAALWVFSPLVLISHVIRIKLFVYCVFFRQISVLMVQIQLGVDDKRRQGRRRRRHGVVYDQEEEVQVSGGGLPRRTAGSPVCIGCVVCETTITRRGEFSGS